MSKENGQKYGLALTTFAIGATLGFMKCLSKITDEHGDKFPDGRVTVSLTKKLLVSCKNRKKKES